MPFHPENQTGAHALDIIQGLSADLGYGWRTGLDASITTSTSSIESEWTAGSILWDGHTVDIPAGTITHDAGDVDNPRWDALAVTDSGGTIQVVKGTPAPVAQDDEGNIYPGEQAWTPSPSDQITREMVVFALVWIPTGASNNDDLTNTSAGGVAEPVVDRRVEAEGRDEQVTRSATITASGWYRIASVGPVENDPVDQPDDLRAGALFTVRDTRETLHSSTGFWASLFFNRHPTLNLGNSSYYTGDHGAVTGLRIVSPDGTYEGGAVEVEIQLQGQSSVGVEYSITHNQVDRGWTPEPWTAGEVPSGFNTTSLDLATHEPVLAAAANQTDDMFVVQRDGTTITDHTQQRNVVAVARLTTDLTVPDGTQTTIPFDVAPEDDWGAWDTTNGNFSVPQDGWYSVRAQARWIGMADGTRLGTLINASGYTAHRCWVHSGAANVVSGVANASFDLTAGDEIFIQVRQNSGSDRTVGGNETETFCAITYEG